MNKPQLQERAKELNISFEDSDTNKELQAKIAEKEAELSPVDEKFAEPTTEEDLRTPEEVEEVDEVAEELLENSIDMPETIPEGERTDEVEEAANDDETLKEKATGIITTSSFAPEKADPAPVVRETKTVEENKADAPKGSKVYKYVGNSGTYQFSKYIFSKKAPFVVVEKDDVERANDNPRLEVATKDEVEDFYSNAE